MLDATLRHVFPGPLGVDADIRVALPTRESIRSGAAGESLTRQLATFLLGRRSAGYEQLVVGLSGGVDSAVCAQMAWEGAPDAATAVIVDMGDGGPTDDVEFAVQIADRIGIPYRLLDGRPAYFAHQQAMEENRLISRIHVRSRVIVSMVAQFADNYNGLVVDTTDRSEEILHLYEEGWRGHVAPVVELYKSDLYAIADKMALGDVVERRSGCPDLDNFDAFGLKWDQLDWVLDQLVSVGTPPDQIAAESGLDEAWLGRLIRRIETQPMRTGRVRLSLD